jgi:hypothetical protein
MIISRIPVVHGLVANLECVAKGPRAGHLLGHFPDAFQLLFQK